MWTWKTGKRFSSLPYYPTFHTFTFPSPSRSAPSFKKLVLHRYQLAMPRLSRGGYRRIRSVCHICQPTVSEISHEMTSYFAQVLFSVCPMAPLLEKSRLSPGHGAPVSIISWPCLACHVVFKRYNKNQSYNELLIIMSENRQYRLFASFCRSFIIFEFLPLIEPAALQIPLQLTLLLWW